MWRTVRAEVDDLSLVAEVLDELEQIGRRDLVGHVVAARVDSDHRRRHELLVEDERHLGVLVVHHRERRDRALEE